MKSFRLILATAAALAGFVAATPALAQTATAIYDGPVIDPIDGTVRGTITFTVKVAVNKAGAANWTFTGKALLPNATVTFSHKAVDLPLSGDIEISGKTGEKLSLTYSPAGFMGSLTGGKSGGTLGVNAHLNTFADKNNKDAQDVLKNIRGVYNVLLADAQMRGYLSLTVGNLGAVKIAGRLEDGTAVSGSAKLVPGGGGASVAFQRPLYSKKGSLSGWLWGDPVTGQLELYDPMIPVWWESADPKRGIFRDPLGVEGGRYGNGVTAPELLPAMVLNSSLNTTLLPDPGEGWTGSWVASAFPRVDIRNTNGKFSIVKGKAPKKVGTVYDYAAAELNPSMATISFNPKTGLFKGSFKMYFDGWNAAGKPQHKVFSVPYTGVFYPHGGNLWGSGMGTTTINKGKTGVIVYTNLPM